MNNSDPIGKAILDYAAGSCQEDIVVESTMMEDDVIPVSYLFRSYMAMPGLEQKALTMCKGRVLDVGAGAGCHSLWLTERGMDVVSLDSSPGAVQHLMDCGLEAKLEDVFYHEDKYDTILILMNGIGIGGDLNGVTDLLKHLKSLLNEGGQILVDSSDVSYLFDGTPPPPPPYYGEFKFRLHYSDQSSGWFDWTYVDPVTLNDLCLNEGYICEQVEFGTNGEFLAKITLA